MHAHNKVCLPDLRHCCEMFAHAKLKLQGTHSCCLETVQTPMPAFGSDAAESFEGQTGLIHSAGSGNIASGQQSDHLLMAAAYNGWLAAKLKVCSLPACGSCSNIIYICLALTGFISYVTRDICDLFCAAVAINLTRELAICLQLPVLQIPDCASSVTYAGMWHAGWQAGRASVCPQALPE